jgi:hypothetical protein
MVNYTEQVGLLVRDIVSRVPRLSHVDPDSLLVFARCGRRGASGPVATCHCLTLPVDEPGYYFWRDRDTGRITRRSPWFVTRSPRVTMQGRRLSYLISIALPRFCDQTLSASKKRVYYDADAPEWIARLDTVVHELYHIDPGMKGIRRVQRRDGCGASMSHGRRFLEDVADMVREYLATGPDPAGYEFLRHDFAALEARYGGVAGTTFRTFPSFPQRYDEAVPVGMAPLAIEMVPVEPLAPVTIPTEYSEQDLRVRQFVDRGM